MSKRGDWVSFNSFRGGEQSDLPPHEIPDDALLKASNVLTDKRGRLAKRGPIQPYLTNESNATLEQIGVSKLNLGFNQPNSGWAVAGLNYYWFSLPNPPTYPRAGFISPRQSFNIGVDSPVWGPSFNSFGLTAFPLECSNGFFPFAFFGSSPYGNLGATVDDSAGTVSVTANSQTISLTSSGSLGLYSNWVGKIIYVNNNSAGPPNTTNEYIGVIVSAGLNSFTVYPAPSKTWSATGTAKIVISDWSRPTGRLVESGGTFNLPASTSFGCVHQNRVVVISQTTTSTTGSVLTTPVQTQNNVISWSAITGESATAANTNADGILALLYAGWPKSQTITLDTSSVVGVVSLDANNLLILCADKTLLLSGTLGTIVPAGSINTSSFNIRTVSGQIGCIDAASIQRTPLGVMFAGRDGVYITDGASFQNVMEGKIQAKWNVYDGTNSAPLNKVTGSALLKDTHYAVFTQKGPHFICDIYNDFSWTELEFENSLFSGVSYPEYVTAAPVGPTPVGDMSSVVNTTSVSLDGQIVVQDGTDSPPRFDSTNPIYIYTNGGSQSVPLYTKSKLFGPATWNNGGIYSTPRVDDSGTRIVVWGRIASGSPTRSRVAYYENIAGVWTLQQDFNTGIYSQSNQIGFASENGDRLAYAGGAGVSSVVVLKRTGSVWATEQTITPPTGNLAGLPYVVTMSSDGTYLAVADTTFNSARGRIYVYSRSGTVWSLTATVDPSGANPNAQYGSIMHLTQNGNWLILGAAITGAAGSMIQSFRRSGASFSWFANLVYDSNNQTPYIYTNSIASYTRNANDVDLYIAEDTYDSLIYYKLIQNPTTQWQLVSRNKIPSNPCDIFSIGIAGNGKSVYVGDGKLNYNINPVTLSQTFNGGFHVFDVYAENGAPPIWGIGVRDWSGSTEVYAPRLNASNTVAKSSVIVLLDSILATDEYPASVAIDASPVIDAACVLPFNAQVTTKAFALGDPTQLKAYKSVMMTYEADPLFSGGNPVQIRFGESLNPNVNYAALAYDEAPATTGGTTQSHRTSLIPRPIDNGIAFGFNTNYSVKNDGTVGSGHFKLYEFFLNVTGLRKGRTIQ